MFRPPTDSQAAPRGPLWSRHPSPRSAFHRSAQDVVDLLSSSAIALGWLVRLRWHAVGGTALTVFVAVRVLGLDLPVVPLLAVVATTGVSNLLLALWLRRAPVVKSHHLGGVLAFDIMLLTALLALSGGPDNPFAMLYLVHVALAALVLGPRWTFGLSLLSILGPALLVNFHVPLRELAHVSGSMPANSRHVLGMWVAFTLTVMLIALMVARVSAALRDRQEALVRAQLLTVRAEKLASLSTLAAGAAHELGTPLGTIAIAANELEALILEEPHEALEDARLIRDQVERCRDILERMSARAGQTYGEVPEPTTTSVVLERLREQLSAGELARLRFAEGPDLSLCFPMRGLVQVLANLVRNGLHASDASQSPVTVSVRGDAGRTTFVVEDQGTGIPRDVLARLGEPFFTTKPAGQGMGLGLFLGQTFAELCGGRLELSSEEGKGTRATLDLPCRREPVHAAA
ncbi:MULTISPECIES: ATP-binding protein [unclassified Myxococcus]|uniref:ATP-binding protein n=1 Tax=unclassified Myxococcus TaxID=2648731 RepID=UPI00157A3986|nr:HAMP domain-containing histidine kinase [Myxococcus sp. CA040A]NTX41561.1 HAMP domain-containing histidine kinase [Myxococcus sp. CA033]NTX52026.1 HAMP domain-containing histidine kinase [Myxococcus sp. CA039A]